MNYSILFAFILFLGFVFATASGIDYYNHNSFARQWDAIDISRVAARNKEYSYGGGWVQDIQLNETHWHHITHYQYYVNGYVVYKNWDASDRSGIIVLTGKEQLLAGETEEYVAIYTKRKHDIDRLSIGDICKIDSPRWKKNTHKGKTLYFQYKINDRLKKTGYMSLDDPDYAELLRNMQDYEHDADFDTMMTIIIIIMIVNMNNMVYN